MCDRGIGGASSEGSSSGISVVGDGETMVIRWLRTTLLLVGEVDAEESAELLGASILDSNWVRTFLVGSAMIKKG